MKDSVNLDSMNDSELAKYASDIGIDTKQYGSSKSYESMSDEELLSMAKSKGVKVNDIIETEDDPVGLPKLSETEKKIRQREDMFGKTLAQFVNDPTSLENLSGLSSANLIGGAQQRIEAALANPLLDMQEGKAPSFKSMVKGISGERLSQFGDTVRRTGFGSGVKQPLFPQFVGTGLEDLTSIDTNELIAMAVGMGVDAGIANTISAGNLVKLVKKTRGSIQETIDDAANVVNKSKKAFQGIVDDISTVTNKEKSAAFANNLRKKLFDAKHMAGKEFDQTVDILSNKNPDRVIDVFDSVELLKDDAGADKAFNRIVKSAERKIKSGGKLTVLENVLTDSSKSKNLSLREAIELKNQVKSNFALSAKLNKGSMAEYTVDDLPALDFLDEIRASQMDAFPEMAEQNAAYSEVLSDYRLVKNKFKRGSLISNVKNNFGDDPETLVAVDKLLDSDTIRSMKGYKNASRIIKEGTTVGRYLLAGAAISAGAAGARAIFFK
jgi:hypothetical protein